MRPPRLWQGICALTGLGIFATTVNCGTSAESWSALPASRAEKPALRTIEPTMERELPSETPKNAAPEKAHARRRIGCLGNVILENTGNPREGACHAEAPPPVRGVEIRKPGWPCAENVNMATRLFWVRVSTKGTPGWKDSVNSLAASSGSDGSRTEGQQGQGTGFRDSTCSDSYARFGFITPSESVEIKTVAGNANPAVVQARWIGKTNREIGCYAFRQLRTFGTRIGTIDEGRTPIECWNWKRSTSRETDGESESLRICCTLQVVRSCWKSLYCSSIVRIELKIPRCGYSRLAQSIHLNVENAGPSCRPVKVTRPRRIAKANHAGIGLCSACERCACDQSLNCSFASMLPAPREAGFTLRQPAHFLFPFVMKNPTDYPQFFRQFPFVLISHFQIAVNTCIDNILTQKTRKFNSCPGHDTDLVMRVLGLEGKYGENRLGA